MKKLTHKQILNYLKKEGLLYEIIEDENCEGELEITGIQLNTIANIIKEMKRMEKSMIELIKDLKVKIRSKKGGAYFDKLSPTMLRNKTIIFEKDTYILDSPYLTMSNCYISNTKKIIGSKPMLTVAGK